MILGFSSIILEEWIRISAGEFLPLPTTTTLAQGRRSCSFAQASSISFRISVAASGEIPMAIFDVLTLLAMFNQNFRFSKFCFMWSPSWVSQNKWSKQIVFCWCIFLPLVCKSP
jgi:hypothetical protein